MKINWFQVVLGALLAWSWLLLVLDQMGWRRKKGHLVETSQFFVASLLALCHMRNDGISACEGRVYLWWTCALFWSYWTSLDLMGMGSSCLVVLKFGWSAHVISSCWDLCMGWLGSAGLCSWASLGLVIPTKWRVLSWVIYMGFCKFCNRGISWEMSSYISHEWGI